MSQPTLLGRTVQQTQEWLKALAAEDAIADEDRALSALRGVLGQLRDRLPPGEAAHLASQLPTLVRGIYYENYRPDLVPEKERHETDFLVRVAERIDDDRIDPAAAVKAVFDILSREIAQGEISDVIHMMPAEVKTLWPEEAQSASAAKHHH